MSDTSWDFESPSKVPTGTPAPASVSAPTGQNPVIAAPVAPPAHPAPLPSFAAPSSPDAGPLAAPVIPSLSPSRSAGQRSGVLPPPLPTPPIKTRPGSYNGNPAFAAPSALGHAGFAPPSTPPTRAESVQRVAAAKPAKTRGGWGWRALVAFLAGALISGAAFTAGTLVGDEPGEAAAPVTVPASSNEGATVTPPAAPAPGDVQENPAAFVAEDLGPSVVQIFTNFGTGSGVVYRDGGYIMTNNHVIDGATEVFVRDFQGRSLSATVVGSDPRVDVAVLQVTGLDLPVADLALGQELKVGSTAIAIGSPFDLTRTVTSGIISALNRPLEAQGGTFTAMIQTDAPINPGNSGGPLANRNGDVIGINTAIRTDGVSNSNIGVGFAIPIDGAYRVAERIVSGEPLEPGFLGVQRGQPAIGEIGVVVTAIDPLSGAADAGLRDGDRVLTVDGAPVTSFEELAGLITTNFPGDDIELEVVRGETPLTLTATLGDRP